MGALLFILPVICIVIGIMLLRGQPRRRQVWLALFAIVCTTFVFSLGYMFGGITPTYRGEGAIGSLLVVTNRALEAGDYENTRAAFQEAISLVKSHRGDKYDAVTMISERLRPPTAAPVIPAQPE